MKTDQQIVDEANALAREFYAIRGYAVPPGYRFDQATHPHEVQCWLMAKVAFETLTGTDVENALAALEEE